MATIRVKVQKDNVLLSVIIHYHRSHDLGRLSDLLCESTLQSTVDSFDFLTL